VVSPDDRHVVEYNPNRIGCESPHPCRPATVVGIRECHATNQQVNVDVVYPARPAIGIDDWPIEPWQRWRIVDRLDKRHPNDGVRLDRDVGTFEKRRIMNDIHLYSKQQQEVCY
jgi:hypothetical protein